MANTRAALTRLAPVMLVAFGLVMLFLATRSFVGSSGFAYDYQAYDAAARRLAAGQALYPPGTAEAYNSGAYEGLYLYPPPPAVALVPLVTVLAPDAAALAWLWLRLAALAIGIAILPISALARGATFAAAAISFPVWYDLNLGNTSVLLFALSAAVWRFQSSAVGAVALAVAGVLRYPFGIVLLGWAVARRWRTAGWTVAAGLAIGAVTLPVVGVGGWLDYAVILRGLGDISGGEHNLSLATTAQASGIPGPPAVWVALGIGIALVATIFAARRRDPATAVVVSLAATILFFPFFHPHYLVQLLIPAAFLAARGQWWGLVLPVLGWLPGEVMPLVAIAGVVLPLTPPSFLAISSGGARLGAAAEFGTGPMRP
ncbi:MAG: glycosyltransferase 87 family protein [Candidatus Limnocylindrales bacterium]